MRAATCLLVIAALAVPTGACAEDADWSGIYVGVEAGSATDRVNYSIADVHTQLSNIVVPGRGLVVVPGTSFALASSRSETDPIYGGFIGGQMQTGGAILGFEGDFHGPRELSIVNASVSVAATILAPASTLTIDRNARISYDWSLRARIGTPIGSRAMIYATGGIAGARINLTGTDTFATPAGAAATGGGIAAFASPAIGPVVIASTGRQNFTGWTAGGGGEFKVSSRLGVGLDARYTDYGARTFALGGSCTPAIVAAGTCAGTTRSAPPIVINGTTLNPSTDVTPGTVPGPTFADVSDFRVTARVVLHF